MTYRKKLIEVALPLEAINVASAREKSIRHGHPSTLHLWWARRPLAACRAVLFASLVDDPGEYIKDEKAAQAERERLFDLITKLVQWENTNNQEVLDRARLEIACSVARNLGVPVPVGKQAILQFLAEKAPPVLDPFAGGGSIPLEAQRLGLRAYASDLNPVAVLINKALIEIPPKFANQPPVHMPDPHTQTRLTKREWHGAEGLAEDVRYYGKWMRDEAEKHIGHLYPKVKLPKEHGGGEAPVVAWIWARTVRCPNPACGAIAPLVRSFELSKKKGKRAWVEPVVDRRNKSVHFEARSSLLHGNPPSIDAGTSVINERGKKVKATFKCPVCDAGILKGDYIDSEATAGRMSIMPLAVVAQTGQGRVYVSVPEEQSRVALEDAEKFLSDSGLVHRIPTEPARGTFASNAQGRIYGFRAFADYFTKRQLVALMTLGESVIEARQRVLQDAVALGRPQDEACSYADAICLYLGLATGKLADRNSSIVSWDIGSESLRSTFARQAIPMMWDFCESNPFEDMGSIEGAIEWIQRLLPLLPTRPQGKVQQLDASARLAEIEAPMISTDPPYYGNVAYADLSDFFYVWLRRSLGNVFPQLFTTLLTPKAAEISATPFRFEGDRTKAQQFFEENLGKVFVLIRRQSHQDYPFTVFYAFKQSEEGEEEEGSNSLIASTGWETMLEALMRAGFQITGTLPMRTELGNRPVASGTNALASSIVLACRSRSENAQRTTRREFLSGLKKELPSALRELQQGNIAPVDLAQAAIGPGMAVFSQYREVLEPDGTPMRVRTALALINQVLDEFLTEQEGEYDADTRWALAWFEQYGHEAGPYGVAETLSKAKNTGIDGLVRAGILESRAGQVHLLRRDELAQDWDPRTDQRLTAWETAQYLVRALEKGGEQPAAALLRDLGAHAETARDLAYRLYTLCERKGWAQEALGYNMLVVAWPRLTDRAAQQQPKQERML